MRILLDECMPARLARELTGHEVTTVVRMRWGGVDDRRLIGLAERQVDAFITVDQSLERHLPAGSLLPIVTVFSPSNSFDAVRPYVPEILAALESIQPGDRVHIGQ